MSPFQIAAKLLEVDENVTRAHLRTNWLGVNCEVMPRKIVQLSPKPQMSGRRSSTICAVVEWSDHHCGDDLDDLQFDVNIN